MKLLVQADGIQLTPENQPDHKLLEKLAGGCKVYPISKFVAGENTYRLVIVKGEGK